jgi:hypothetical protein
VTGPHGYGADELECAVDVAAKRAENMMQWNRTTIERAQLIHVSADLSDILFASVETVPGDTVLDETMPPTPYGLVVFEIPFIGMDSGEVYDACRVDALAWGPCRVPARSDVEARENIRPGFSVAAFRWIDFTDDDRAIADYRRLHDECGMPLAEQDRVMPLGRTDWVTGETIDTVVHDGLTADDKAHLSMVEDRRLIAALWSLIASKRIVETTTVSAPKAARKRLERRGDTSDTTVEVVHLRRREYLPSHDDGGTGRRVGVRFAVRPHWRNQAHGPNHSLRKLILVPPHMKGPDGAPLRHVERVWSVDS